MREQIRDKGRLEHILDAIEKSILVHGYYQTSDSVVWDTIKNYLPTLQKQIKTIYENMI